MQIYPFPQQHIFEMMFLFQKAGVLLVERSKAELSAYGAAHHLGLNSTQGIKVWKSLSVHPQKSKPCLKIQKSLKKPFISRWPWYTD